MSTTTTSTQTKPGFDLLYRQPALTTLVVVLLVALIWQPAFYAPQNLRAVAIQSAILGIVVLGQTIALIGRGLDMSVAAVMTFAAVLITQGSADYPLLGLAVPLLVLPVLVGLANGFLVIARRVPAFVATFAMLIVIEGARMSWTKGQGAGSAPAWAKTLGQGSIAGIPTAVVIWLVLLALVWLALNRSSWGRWLYATGTSPVAARHVGIPIRAVALSTFFCTAFCAVIAGVLLSGYVGYVDNTLGSSYNLNSMAAAIIGGVAFSGGRGSVLGATCGVLLMTVLVNLLVLFGLDLFWQRIVEGGVLVAAVLITGLQDRLGTNR
jgi:ribose/xylose/arabinose/galactoside ABC-type transport system permease subunit